MDPFAQPSDIEAIWRPLTEDEIAVAVGWINEASLLVREQVPDVGGLDVDERIVAGTLKAETVRSVVARTVRRVLMNPEGKTNHSEGLGDFQQSDTYGRTMSTGDLYLSARDLARLSGTANTSTRQRAFTITPGPGPVFSWP